MAEKAREETTETKMTADENKPDITQVIDAIVAVCLRQKKPVDAFMDCAVAYKGECFVFVKEQCRQFLEEQLKKSKQEKVRALSENEFANRLIGSMLGIKNVVTNS